MFVALPQFENGLGALARLIPLLKSTNRCRF